VSELAERVGELFEGRKTRYSPDPSVMRQIAGIGGGAGGEGGAA
jgi:hypothetical protein